jgi:RND family efflux transporter MFP subunit
VHTVKLEDVAQTFAATGHTAPLQTVAVRAQVSALVAEVKVREGDIVKRGQVLLELDSRVERANLAKAQANLAKSQANLKELQRQLKQSQSLLDQNFVSPSATSNLAAQVDAQMAQVKADEAALAAQDIQVSLFTITAPISGRLGRIDVVPGTLVSSGSSATALMTITQMDPMGVEFSLPQAQVQAIRSAGVGAPVNLQLPNQDQMRKGVLTFYDSAINSDTGMMGLKAKVPNTQQDLWPGTAVQVTLEAKSLQQVAVIPQASLVIREMNRSVFVVGEDGQAKPQKVTPLATMREFVAVRGLKDGQKIVVDGRQNVRPGAKVRVVGPAAVSSSRE